MQSIQKHLNDLRIATGTALKQTHIVSSYLIFLTVDDIDDFDRF